MSHRRKSSHPMCKTRRNLDLQHDDSAEIEDDDDFPQVSSSAVNHDNRVITMPTGEDEAQQLVLPSDLYKDFEAVRSQAKLDATNLMRRLLKDYQSLAGGSDKPLTVHTSEGHLDTDLHVNETLSTTTSIAKDVSLATTRVDTDDDQFQGLDLSVGTRKINSQLFDTKSLDREIGTFDQPLDLTCSKSIGIKEEQNRESPSSSQLDLHGASNEFNYVYVYPGLYPPGAVVNAHDDLDVQPGMVSPVPELMSPGKIPSPDTLSRAQYLATTEALESAYAMTGSDRCLKEFAKRGQVSPSSVSPIATVSPGSIKKEPGEIIDVKPRKTPPYEFATATHNPKSTPSSTKGSKSKESKRSTEMKVISENTCAGGVYTSVMKLPWSRRTRTKKPKHKVKLEDTLIPQFMLEENQTANEDSAMSTGSTPPSYEQSSPYCSTPASTQSVMMVYPNVATTAYGKPVKKRGRPPKLPMLAKLLHNRIGKKGEKPEKETEEMQAQITQVQENGGMVVYNAGGQITTSVGGVPMQPVHVQVPPTPDGGAQPLQSPMQQPMIPNMTQAQFLGQIPLSQLTGGPIQFLGQFPANALPFPGQAIQAFPTPLPILEGQGQPVLVQGHGMPKDENDQNSEVQPQPANIQYAFQPMLIPHQMAVPFQQPVAVPMETEDIVTETPSQSNISTTIQDTSNGTSGVSESIMASGSTHVMKHSESGTISTMSTTSISNTESGAIYQEMILSSKSLVDVKKRRRQTAIQMLKSKSGDNNFLCTSFRIRPRLVAQAQAQKERQAARGVKEEYYEEASESLDSKNLIGPQNDPDHFGENNSETSVDFSNIQIKQEVDTDDEVYANIREYESSVLDKTVNEQSTVNEQAETGEIKPNVATKRYMLKGSQKRKAKFYGSRIVNEQNDVAAMRRQSGDKVNIGECGDMDSSDLFQEMFNCKICNKIISVDDMESHSLDHLKSTVYQCKRCGKGFGENQITQTDNPTCSTCNEPLVTVGALSESGESKIACDECTETFKSLPEFYEHKTAHKNSQTAQGGFECDFCGKIYQYYHALQFHRRTHRERRVPCLEKSCDMKFRSRKEMENHFDSRHPEKKEYFFCVYEGCTKKFLKNFHLQEHIRVKHYNIKAFQCPWPGCVKEFAAQRHLKIHLLIHRDEKPMKCDHCDYRCRQRSAMNWHMRKHPDVPYKYKRAVKSPSISKSESE